MYSAIEVEKCNLLELKFCYEKNIWKLNFQSGYRWSINILL